MSSITLKQAAAWCGGTVDAKYENVTFFGANNDSRNLLPGQLFVALQGARDGHAFISAAMEKGAAAVLCSRPVGDCPAILVEDTRKALGDIARGERQRLGMKVVGVTGSVGKSTTKEMIACVLETTYRTGKSPVNHNNDLGLPMAILALPEDTQVAVLEMGMNHFREMAYLSSIARPDIGVIISIGTMHIEHLGSMEGILRAKLEILEGMDEHGKLVLNGDDQLLWNLRRDTAASGRYFGFRNSQCGIFADDLEEAEGMLRFRVNRNGEWFVVELPVEGEHYVSDALAAITVALELGISQEAIQDSLSRFRNMAGRQEIFSANGRTIIKDCYNAGPESMAAALNVLGNRSGRRIAVLGDMLELGTSAQAEHYRVGRIAAEKTDLLLAYGPNSCRVISGAVTGGMPDGRARGFEDREELLSTLHRLSKPGDVVLFKGSHGMRMDLILEDFLKEEK